VNYASIFYCKILPFVVEKYYNFFSTSTGVKILRKFTTIKVVIYSSIFLGKKTTFCSGNKFHSKRWLFTFNLIQSFFHITPLKVNFSHPLGFTVEGCTRDSLRSINPKDRNFFSKESIRRINRIDTCGFFIHILSFFSEHRIYWELVQWHFHTRHFGKWSGEETWRSHIFWEHLEKVKWPVYVLWLAPFVLVTTCLSFSFSFFSLLFDYGYMHNTRELLLILTHTRAQTVYMRTDHQYTV